MKGNIIQWLAVAWLALCAFNRTAHAEQKQYAADVVVYGDASGGVTAAIQAARMGKSVILVSHYGHLGCNAWQSTERIAFRPSPTRRCGRASSRTTSD